MYLKKVELLGFKSFADKTDISFEQGVTCIVGPNGCGKSNISDSIRWVLGERSAKLLRGARMEDVIFSGTDFRKPVNFSEVSLTIDNSDHKLPIQYEEVVVTRRLHRSGESEYLINKTPCRLKDVQDLILDTGIGSNSYSMMEQGRIDYILNAEAEERRFLIEEAAGISKYKVKKEEALRKLERAQENLVRLNDILSEVERNIRYAERQAQRAERYKEQLERLKKLEIQKSFHEIKNLDRELKALACERNERMLSVKTLEEHVHQLNQEAREVEEMLHEQEQRFLDKEAARSEVKQELITIESQEAFLREKIDFIKANSEKALGEVESLAKRCEDLCLELKTKRQERSQLLTTLAALEAQKKEKENLLHDRQSGTSSSALPAQQTLVFALARKMSDAKNWLNKKQVEWTSLERAQATLQDSRNKLMEMRRSLGERQGSITNEREGALANLDESRRRLTELIQEQTELNHQRGILQTNLDNRRAHKTKLETQWLLLQELELATGPDPKRIVAEHASHVSPHGMVNALLDLVEIESGYEAAAEAVFSDSIKAIVADNLETAVHLLDRLKGSDSQHATILIKDRAVLNGSLARDHRAEEHPLVRKRLWDVVRVKEGYDGIFGNLLGKVYVVDEITPENVSQLAKLAERVKLVSKSGAAVGPEFQIKLQKMGSTPEKSTFVRQAEIEKLTHEINLALSDEKKTASDLLEVEQRSKSARDQIEHLREDAGTFQAVLERMGGTGLGISEHLKHLSEELTLLETEDNQTHAEIEQLKTDIKKLSLESEALEAEQMKAQDALNVLQNHVQEDRSFQDTIERELDHLSSKIELQDEKARDMERTLSFLDAQSKDTQARIGFLKKERAEALASVEQLTNELENHAHRKKKVTESLLECSVECEQLRRSRGDLARRRNQELERYQNVAKELGEFRQILHDQEIKEMELDHKRTSICENLASRYEINLLELNPVEYEISAKDILPIEEELAKLREKLEGIGTVNLLAIEEYQELKSRHEFLINQKRDLTEAQESLLEAIRKINRTTKKLFEETLVSVQNAFREYFRTLFGGGQADLILIDGLNPLDSGIDIVARPPGKKLQHITLLSGGEKALTAIALLLALFSVRPSPFCVLDEVDAPLDEANNERFLNVLKPFLSTTQFLIVTHSRKTIAMADALFGITMQEPGVSKIVSVRLASETSEIEHIDLKLAQELNQVLI